jgi:hypothetical protein
MRDLLYSFQSFGQPTLRQKGQHHHVRTESKEFTVVCILRATVLTTGYCGGDSGHGGRTEIVVEDLGSTDIEASFSEAGGKRVTLRLGGDAELRVIIDSLRFVAEMLENLADPEKAKTNAKLADMAESFQAIVERATGAERFDNLKNTLVMLMYKVQELEKKSNWASRHVEQLEERVQKLGGDSNT